MKNRTDEEKRQMLDEACNLINESRENFKQARKLLHLCGVDICDTLYSDNVQEWLTSGSKTGVVYRGIEDFWGNIWEWVDGVNFNGGKYYVCNDIPKYADDTATNYEELSFTGATSWSQSYISEEGLDTGNNPHVMLPSAAGSGSETTSMCDAVWASTGWRVFIHGGDWSRGSGDGLFAAVLNAGSTDANVTFGSRLLYIPS